MRVYEMKLAEMVPLADKGLFRGRLPGQKQETVVHLTESGRVLVLGLADGRNQPEEGDQGHEC